jgi:hypothetical protein
MKSPISIYTKEIDNFLKPHDRIVSVDLMPALAHVNLGISTGRFENLQRVHARELGCHASLSRRRASSPSTPTRGVDFS